LDARDLLMEDIIYPKAGMRYNWLVWQASSYTPFLEYPEFKWCTCHCCVGHWDCPYDGDPYNTNGDCLEEK